MSVEEGAERDDWVEVPEDWWAVSYRKVPWSYRRQYQWSAEGIRYPRHPPPMHYQGLLCTTDSQEEEEDREGDVELNKGLVGCGDALEVMQRYEINVGIEPPPPFDHTTSSNSSLPFAPIFTGALSEEDLVAAKSEWDDLLEKLFDGMSPPGPFTPPSLGDEERRIWNLDLLDEVSTTARTTPDVVDLTDSDHSSAESDPLPLTPHPDKKSYAEVVFVERGASSFPDRAIIAPSPSTTLNASALSFVPASSIPDDTPSRTASPHSYSSTYEFHFPSLNSQKPSSNGVSAKMERDDQGFYNDISSSGSEIPRSHSSTRTATPKRPSAALLPAFLSDRLQARSKPSRTRELVDQLRSTSSSPPEDVLARADSSAGNSSSPVDPEAESRLEKLKSIDGWITQIENTAPKDGWTNGSHPTSNSAKARNNRRGSGGHKRTSSSVSSGTSLSYSSGGASTYPSPTSSLTSFGVPTPSSATFPTTPYPPPTPYVALAPYPPPQLQQPLGCVPSMPVNPTVHPYHMQHLHMQMQMQAQAQAQAQWQMQMQAAAAARMHPVPYPVYGPMPGVVPMAPTVAIRPGTMMGAPYDPRPKITGMSGIRHV